MILQLAVPFRDARAADLSLSVRLDRPAPTPALASRILRVGSVRLDLRVLGASHEARLEHEAISISEVVACGADDGRPLPEHSDLATDDASYRFAARTRACDAETLARLTRWLVTIAGRRPDSVAAQFPGSPQGLTALFAEVTARGASWRTWHVYPQSGEVVRTASHVVLT